MREEAVGVDRRRSLYAGERVVFRKTVVTTTSGEAGDGTIPTRAYPTPVKTLARAFRYQRLLGEGRYASISEMAAAKKIERGHLGALLRLTLLPPALVQAILDGRGGEDVSLPAVLNRFPFDWHRQHGKLPPRKSGRAERDSVNLA